MILNTVNTVDQRKTTVPIADKNTDDKNIILCTNNLCLCYGTKPAIENISVKIPERSITAIIGPSGSGKSSFLCCLNKLTQMNEDCDVTGSIRFRDQEVLADEVSVTKLRCQIGMLFQTPNPFPFSIWKNLELPLRHHGIRNKEIITEKIETVLKDVGLWQEVNNRLKNSAQTLSGGQQQRLCLARALILKPEVILMDEPCSALDPLSSQHIEKLIRDLSSTCTVAIVTHNLAQAQRIADYVAFFWNQDNKGQLIEYGTTEQIFKSPRHELTKAYVISGN